MHYWLCRPMIDEEPSPEKHTHKPAEPSTSKPAASAAVSIPAGAKGAGPLSMPVPKTDLSAGAHAVCYYKLCRNQSLLLESRDWLGFSCLVHLLWPTFASWYSQCFTVVCFMIKTGAVFQAS